MLFHKIKRKEKFWSHDFDLMFDLKADKTFQFIECFKCIQHSLCSFYKLWNDMFLEQLLKTKTVVNYTPTKLFMWGI